MKTSRINKMFGLFLSKEYVSTFCCLNKQFHKNIFLYGVRFLKKEHRFPLKIFLPLF